MQRIATLILPLRDAYGERLDYQHAHIRDLLNQAFDDFTAQRISGEWVDLETGLDYGDDCLEYRISAWWTGKQPKRLENIAAEFCRLARLECVCLIDPDGETQFIAPGSHVTSARAANAFY